MFSHVMVGSNDIQRSKRLAVQCRKTNSVAIKPMASRICAPDSEAAIKHLELLRGRGADYFLIPRTAMWWRSSQNAGQMPVPLVQRIRASK